MALSRTEFLKCSTLLPIVVPIAGLLIEFTLWPFRIAVPRWLDDAFGYALSGLLYFAPAYGVVVGAMLLFLIGRSFRAHIAAAVGMPLAMAFLVELGLSLLSGRPLEFSLFAGVCLILGYSYVALSFVGLVFASRIGWVRRE